MGVMANSIRLQNDFNRSRWDSKLYYFVSSSNVSKFLNKLQSYYLLICKIIKSLLNNQNIEL